jgi:acyl-coenzyme A synthetase/AMP-(fatty) acid ligase
MRDLGIERGDRVMVTLGKVPEWHAVLLGLLKLGAIAIPSSPMLRANDLKFRTEHSGAVALISGPESVEEIEKVRDEVPNLRHLVLLGEEREGWKSYEKLVEGASEDFTAEDTTSDEGAFLLYTSVRPSTRRAPCTPTATPTPSGCKPATGWISRRTIGSGVPPRAAGPRPCGTSFWVPGAGGRSSSCRRQAFDPAERLELIGQYGITVLCQAPTEYRVLANAPELEGADLSSVRHALSAGEPLNAPVIERWKELHGLTIYDGYGQTENTLLVGNFPGVEVRPGSMGKPSPGCDVRIIDEDGKSFLRASRGISPSRVTTPRSCRGTGSSPRRPRTSCWATTT